MQSRTSFFNKTVFFSDLRQFWPLTAGYALLWLLVLPLSRFTELVHDMHLSGWNAQFETLNLTAHLGYLTAFVFGILFAMAAFSYLTNSRATYGLHALPLRREAQYAAHYLAGPCAQLAPQLLAVLLTMLVLASRGAFSLRLMGLMLLTLALPTLFFYSFGVFCMIFTGQILAAPVFYGVLNVLAVGVETLIRAFAGKFLYGWAYSGSPALVFLSPLLEMLDVRAARAGEGASSVLTVEGLEWLLIYAAAGLVLALLGLLVYRKRHSEATGSTVAIGWARPLFKYGVAFCAALALGLLLYELFFGQYRTNGVFSLPGTLACMAAAGLLGYFTAEMLLKKSFRVLRSGWKGAAAVTAVLVALGFVLSLDLTGYEGYVPEAEQVDCADIYLNIYNGGMSVNAHTSDPETLRLLTEAHRALVSDKARQQRYAVTTAEWPVEGTANGYLSIDYRLRDGRIVSRQYDRMVLLADERKDPASPAAAVTALYNAGDVTLQRALSRNGSNGVYDARTLPDLRFTGGYISMERFDREDYQFSEDRDLTPAEAQAIYDAVLRDVEAGRAGGSLFEQDRRALGMVDLYATYYDPDSSRTVPADSPTLPPEEGEKNRAPVVFEPLVTERMTETLSTLRRLGLRMEFE